MIVPSLEDPRAKLARAGEHLQTLDTEVVAFLKSKPYRTLYERNLEDGSHVWGVEVHHTPPMRLSIIVGDIIHNLRSCLDHLVWQLSLVTTETPYSRSEFPIYDVKCDPKSDECFDKRGCRKIRDVPYLAKKFIESVQPYHGRHWPDVFLRLLHELNNADKHRIILVPKPTVALFSVPAGAFGYMSPSGLPVGMTVTPAGKDRYEILRLPGDTIQNRQQKENVQFAFEVGIQTSEAGKRGDMSARDLMEMMRLTVKDILQDCERFFISHGPGF